MFKKIILLSISILIIFSNCVVFANEDIEAVGDKHYHSIIKELLEQKAINDYQIITDPLRSSNGQEGFAGDISDKVIDHQIIFGNVHSTYSFKLGLSSNYSDLRVKDILEQKNLFWIPVIIKNNTVGIAEISKSDEDGFSVLSMTDEAQAKLLEKAEKYANKLNASYATKLFFVDDVPYFRGIVLENNKETFAFSTFDFGNIPQYTKISLSQLLPLIEKAKNQNSANDIIGGIISEQDMHNYNNTNIYWVIYAGVCIILVSVIFVKRRKIKMPL